MCLGPLPPCDSPNREPLWQAAQSTPNILPVRQQFLSTRIIHRAKIHCGYIQDVRLAGPFVTNLLGLLLA